MKYNYLEAVKEDIKEYIKENNINLGEINKEDLSDTLYLEDSITGNASGSYYCNTWKAEEAICHNMDLLAEALECFGYNIGNEYYHLSKKGAEWCDVIIRCYVLSQALDEVTKEMIQND